MSNNDEYIGKIRKRLQEDAAAREEREKRRRKVLGEQMSAHQAQEVCMIQDKKKDKKKVEKNTVYYNKTQHVNFQDEPFLKLQQLKDMSKVRGDF